MVELKLFIYIKTWQCGSQIGIAKWPKENVSVRFH